VGIRLHQVDMWRATYPHSGTVYVFRAKRTDRIKLIFWDGTGVCLMANDPSSYYGPFGLS
jgi:transposase